MKGLLRKDCYLMMKYCRVFLLVVFIFTIVGIKIIKSFLRCIQLYFPALFR